MDERLYRSVNDRMLAGVAGGVAERLDADPSIIRIVWALLLVFTGGIALVAYLVMAIVVPEDPDQGIAAPAAGSTAGAAASGPTAGPDAPPLSPRDARRAARQQRRANRRDGRGAFIGGLVLIAIGGYFLIRQVIPASDLGSWWPVILVGIGAVLVLVSIVPGRRPD